MPIFNLEGEREATTQNSEEYGKKVIEFLNLQGYNLLHDSNIEGCFQDKIFQNSKMDGNRKTVVEIKDTKLSLSAFIPEYSTYLKINLKEEMNLFVFARSISNIDKWKKIFDLAKQTDSDLEDFFKSIKKELNEDIDFSLFKKFVNNTKIYQSSYDKLLQKIEQIKKENIYEREEDYLIEIEKIIYEKEELDSNIFKITSFPDKLYFANLKKNSEFNSIWKNPTADKYVQFGGTLYSIRQIPDEILDLYCDRSSFKEIDFKNLELDDDKKKKLIQLLIRTQIICKGFDERFYYNRTRKMLYKPHLKLDSLKEKVKVEKEKLRYLSKVYRKKEDNSLNFVLHRALMFEVVNISEDYFVIFDDFRLFTKDGKTLMDGEGAKKLNYKFPPTKAYNNNEKSKLFFLIKAIGLFKSNLFHMNQFTFKGVKFEIACKAELGEIFNENFDYEENVYPTLKDYFEE